MKKVYFIICIIALITFLTGIPYVITGIAERGMDGVNYGRVVFPLLISAVSFWLYRKQNHTKREN